MLQIRASWGNFKDGELSGQTNGQAAYGKARQDIFIAGYDNAGGQPQDAESLVVSGALDVPAGSIWVWAEKQPHYEMLKQFAVFDDALIQDGAVTLTDDELARTFAAFRNAQTDEVTLCGADYLTGQAGENGRNIYWTGGFDVSFLKVDGYGNALAGARFMLYTGIGVEDGKIVPQKPYQRSGEIIEATSADSPAKDGDPAKGTVFFEKLPTGVYYLVEEPLTIGGEQQWPTTTEGDATLTWTNKNFYLLLVGDKAMEKKNIGLIAEFFLADIEPETIKALSGGQDAVILKLEDFVLAEGDTDENHLPYKAVTNPDIASFGLLNVSTTKHKVILRKVADTYASLVGARFRIFYADLSEMTAGQTIGEDGVGYYESDESGVYFVGNLPTGTYYIWETKAPDAYTKNEGKVYILTVDANGVAQRELGKVEGTGLGTKATGDFGEFRDWMKVQLDL